ncbi:recombinase family protein [Streptomyces castrisilvae]|uniref:recombinase family protein n=1 Tax=Streptomyces castrisilvae TaxID=3033811 RepID=UPI00353253D7
MPSADIRIGYARCSHLSQELDSQLDALSKHGIPRDKIFSEKISTRVRVRPRFEAALRTAREIKAHAPHCRVIFTVHEMKRLGRDAAELTALADHLTAHGLVLETLAGPLPGIYDPAGAAPLLFAFFAAMAETERANTRESTLEGLDTAARKGKHGGRPPVITDDMLHTVLRRRANGESVEQIQPDLIIPTGKRKGRSPSVASVYRALAEHAKHEAYHNRVGHHDYEGVALISPNRDAPSPTSAPTPRSSCATTARQPSATAPSRRSCAMFHLEKACEIQVTAQAGGTELVLPSDQVAEYTAQQLTGEGDASSDFEDHDAYDLAWAALLRLMERIAPDYKD